MNNLDAYIEKATQLFAEIEDLDAQLRLIKAEMQAQIDEVLGDLKWEVMEIEEEYEPKITKAENRLKALKKELSSLAPAVGGPIEGQTMKAIYYEGRVKIKNPDVVLALAKDNPVLAAAIEVGQPYFAIRVKK